MFFKENKEQKTMPGVIYKWCHYIVYPAEHAQTPMFTALTALTCNTYGKVLHS